MPDDTQPGPLGQRIVAELCDAVAGKPPRSWKASCQPCHRVGWMALVVVPSVVAKEHATALENAGYAWMPNFDPEFGSHPREATVPVARLPRGGYVYVYFKADKRWDIWQVMANGLTRKILHMVRAEQYAEMQSDYVNAPPPKLCSQGAANLPAHLIGIEGATGVPDVWMVYDDHLWAPAVLKQAESNPDVPVLENGRTVVKKLWSARGRELRPAAILEGQFPASGCLPLNAEALKHNVVDFCDRVSGADGNPAGAPVGLVKTFAFSAHPLDEARLGLADALARTVRTIERGSGGDEPERYLNKSVIVMLPDDKGVAAELNTLRLAAVDAKKLWSIGADGVTQAPDAERAWKVASALHVEMIDQWAESQIRQTHGEIFAAGEVCALSSYLTRAQVRKDLVPGTRWIAEPIAGADGKPKQLAPGNSQRRVAFDHEGREIALSDGIARDPTFGRIVRPDWQRAARVDEIAPDQVASRRSRLHERVRWDELRQFRDAFNQESERFDEWINRLDRDHAQWCGRAGLSTCLRFDFDRTLDLTKLDPKRGKVPWQVADFIARIAATERIFGGGAIGPASAKLLAGIYGLGPNHPQNWIDQALLAPFGYADKIVNDADARKDFAEISSGLVELRQEVREALHARSEEQHLEQAVRSLLAVRTQVTHLVAAAVDPKIAAALGLAQQSAAQAQRAYVLHLRAQLVMEAALNPQQRQFVYTIKLPVGVALDELREAMHLGVGPVKFEPKQATTRQERRFTERQFAKLQGRLNAEMQFPVLLDRPQLAKLTKQAVAQGNRLVEVMPDGRIGGAGTVIKVPEHVAREIIRERAAKVHQVLASGKGATLGALWTVQILAIRDAMQKMSEDAEFKGAEFYDGLMSVLSATCGVIEGISTGFTLFYEMKQNGQRTALASTVKSGAAWRLGAGLAGAGAAAFDAAASYMKAKLAKQVGNQEAASAYRLSGRLYSASTVSLLAGSAGTYFATIPSSTAATLGAEQALAYSAQRAAWGLLGSWATGIGVVLTVAGFAYLLYAQSLEYDNVEIFLDRSYWGHGNRTEGKFGGINNEDRRAIGDNRQVLAEQRFNILDHWTRNGLKAEIAAFRGLHVGIKVTFEWDLGSSDRDVLRAKLEAADWPHDYGLEAKLELFEESSRPALRLSWEMEQLKPKRDDKTGRWELELKHVMDSAGRRDLKTAKFIYNVWREHPVRSVTRDELLAKREA